MLFIGLDKQKFQHKNVNIFFPISLIICFRYSKQPSRSFEYPQHMFWLSNEKINFLVRTNY